MGARGPVDQLVHDKAFSFGVQEVLDLALGELATWPCVRSTERGCRKRRGFKMYIHTYMYVCVLYVCVYIYICTYPAAWGAQVQKTQTLIVIKARKYIVAESSSVYIIP